MSNNDSAATVVACSLTFTKVLWNPHPDFVSFRIQ
jgi:hypothetical protein